VGILAVTSLNGVLVALDAPITLQQIARPVTWFFSEERFKPRSNLPTLVNGTQHVKLEVTNQGYAPNVLTVQAGKPVELTLSSHETYSCALSFVLREFGISVDLKPTDTRSISFTPNKKGDFTFSCSMGMYSGTLHVI
jgi:plastocyanin domain-containing protein